MQQWYYQLSTLQWGHGGDAVETPTWPMNKLDLKQVHVSCDLAV